MAKKYRFRLETVRRVRRVEENTALAALARANARVVAAETTLDHRVDSYRRAPLPTGTVPTAAFLAGRHRHDLRAAGVVAARADVTDARTGADERRADWAAAATRVKVLDRLDDRRRAEHAIEARRDEDREVDDIVVGRFGRVAR